MGLLTPSNGPFRTLEWAFSHHLRSTLATTEAAPSPQYPQPQGHHRGSTPLAATQNHEYLPLLHPPKSLNRPFQNTVNQKKLKELPILLLECKSK